MNYESLAARLDDFLDGGLPEDEHQAALQLIAKCDRSRALVARARQMRALLHDAAPVPMPEQAYFDTALAKAAYVGAKQERNRYWLKGFGSAMAAAVALFAVTLVFLRAPDSVGGPSVAMTLEEPQTVNLVFASATELVDATLTIVLPQGIDLTGFEGQREVTWVTTLREGRNVLPLTLVATTPRGGEVMALLAHEDDDREFTLNVTII